ncbi:MAG TPA: DUF190 domain-containing protein [Gammaproteobacteria bacterium]|jgi:PII-like signaling protein|nr:DUF190 domain-containing protein [Gammaproteobacteria bacterium]
MKTIDVVMVRVYITEGSKLLSKIIPYLKNEAKIRGVSVFRAIIGFGETSEHNASLIDMSLDLPITIEFFDDNHQKIDKALEYLSSLLKPEHIVMWNAKANV